MIQYNTAPSSASYHLVWMSHFSSTVQNPKINLCSSVLRLIATVTTFKTGRDTALKLQLKVQNGHIQYNLTVLALVR